MRACLQATGGEARVLSVAAMHGIFSLLDWWGPELQHSRPVAFSRIVRTLREKVRAFCGIVV